MNKTTNDLITAAKLTKNGNVCSLQHFFLTTKYELDRYFEEENRHSAINSIANALMSFVEYNSEYEAMNVVSALLRDKFSYFCEDIEDGNYAILFFVNDEKKVFVEVYHN